MKSIAADAFRMVVTIHDLAVGLLADGKMVGRPSALVYRADS